MQLKQLPQAMLKGSTTRSPFLICFTAAPTSTTTPMFSWPITIPGFASVRPSSMCRSLPQIPLEVIRITASVGLSTRAFSTSSTFTFLPSCNTTACMVLSAFSRSAR